MATCEDHVHVMSWYRQAFITKICQGGGEQTLNVEDFGGGGGGGGGGEGVMHMYSVGMLCTPIN